MTSWFCLVLQPALVRLGSLFHEHKFNMNLNMTLISRSQTGWREKLDMKQLCYSQILLDRCRMLNNRNFLNDAILRWLPITRSSQVEKHKSFEDEQR